MERVATFDFHNTIAHCDPWFELEIRTLPGSVWSWLCTHGHLPSSPDQVEAANVAYRALRERIVASGEERDAVSCVVDVFTTLCIPIEHHRIANAVDALMRSALPALAPVAGALPTIRALQRAGYRLGVVSSAVHHAFLEWALVELRVADAFDIVTTSASSGYYKSRPEIFTVTLDSLGADAAGSVHIGDSLRWDVGGAQRAGMRTAWLRSSSVNTFSAPGPPPTPDLILDSLVDAAPHLLALLHER